VVLLNNSEYILKNNQNEIDFHCPVCKSHHKVNISSNELQQAKFQLKLVQKAYGHEDYGQVIILHIDWESRIRRITAYNFLENNEKKRINGDPYVNRDIGKKSKRIPSREEINKNFSLNLIKPWKSGTSLNLENLISNMIESSKKKRPV
jgi:hypothetical protein